MGEEKPEVVFSKKAIENIFRIFLYISEKGYPATATKFVNQLYEFASQLNIYPFKYAKCRRKEWNNRNFNCAVFKDYVFVYKITGRRLIILYIIHGRRIQ